MPGPEYDDGGPGREMRGPEARGRVTEKRDRGAPKAFHVSGKRDAGLGRRDRWTQEKRGGPDPTKNTLPSVSITTGARRLVFISVRFPGPSPDQI